MVCSTHRLRYRRLARLPSVRVAGGVLVAAAAGAAVAAVLAPPWAPAVVLLVGTATLGGYARRHRARVALEVALARALVRSGDACPGGAEVPGLTATVHLSACSDGVTRVRAACWPDAMRGLGYVMGRDRAFQMDMLRRTAEGRLAEVCGPAMLPADRDYRWLGLRPAAARAATGLAGEERELVTAFTDGVNAAWDQCGPPFECRFLGYRPEPWTVEDCLLLMLYLFHSLSWSEPAKRAEAVLCAALPPSLASLFLPGHLSGAGDGDPEVPGDTAAARAAGDVPADLVAPEAASVGSNCWVAVGAVRPVLACDLHLPLTLPSVLYEVDVTAGDRRVRGLAAAGLPVVLTGTNGDIAWGMTNLCPDVLDLVPATGDAPETVATERIRVRGRDEVRLETVRFDGMPVAPATLRGQRVAVRWTGHDPRTCDLRFWRLARMTSVTGAVALLDRAEGIPLNVLVADAAGRAAHVATGLLPRRPVDRPDAVDGYLDPVERPRSMDPPGGVLVSANDAALTHPAFRIGYHLDPGHRARRLRQALAAPARRGPTAMRSLQHDTAADLYRPYRDLAVPALSGCDDSLAGLLAGWDGRADAGCRAVGVLVRLRQILAQQVLGCYLAACRDHDPAFRYPFEWVDRPLLAILRADDPSLLPRDEQRHGRDGFVARCARQAAAELTAASGGSRLPTWGELNQVGMAHPLVRLAPWARRLLGIRPRAQPGLLHTVRTCVPGFAAVGRAVLPLGGEPAFELPGGQSGHPLSRHFDDRHEVWARSAPRAGRPARVRCGGVLRPAGTRGPEQPLVGSGRRDG